MANTIHIDIVSAEGEVYAGEATMVFAPASGGEIGIAPRHAPLLTTLKPGEVRVQTDGREELLFWVGGGALEVQPHKVTILADTRRGRKTWMKPRHSRPSSGPKKYCATASARWTSPRRRRSSRARRRS